MAIEVALTDERWNLIGTPTVIERLHLDHRWEEFGLLRSIDPWGITIFNRLQMPVFLMEWEETKNLASQYSELEHWAEIKKLAQECEQKVHHYLRFDGE